MKKYEVTDETMKIGMITLHRIKALVAFSDVDSGELGGWIEKESNLDQAGDAWVYGNARVYGNKHYMVIGPIGSRDDTITFTRNKKGSIFASVGCFFGTLAEFRVKVSDTHGGNVHAQAYLMAAQLAELRIDTTPIADTQEEPTVGFEKGNAT